MSQLQNTKSILAKLLATENITISHQPIKTAYFDLQTRTLMCPIWQDMDGELYDLLMGHEVGHALNTPMQGWHDALRDEHGNPVPKAFKDFLNVLEDARIEKKIKRKYPGLAKSFATAYKTLHQKNFFGIRDVDLNTLNFIDRINIYFKMGAHTHVPWRNDFERDIIREVGELETWEQVVELAKRIFEYVKEEEEPQIKNEDDLQAMLDQQKAEVQQQMQEDFGDDSEDSSDDSDDYGSDEDYEDEQGDGADGDSSDSDESENEEQSADGGLGDGETGDEESSDDGDSPISKYGRQEYNNPVKQTKEQQTQKVDSEKDDPESITDRAFRRREQELVNESGHVFMLNLPEANLDKIILSNSAVMSDLERFYQKQLIDPYSIYARNSISYETLAAKCVKKFNARNKKYIMHIFKEFDMRKRATDYARTSIARTGELNMNVLHKYKYSNDLFKKIAVVQKGKSHGLIMYVDMSGSMHDILRNTMEQTLVLVAFCKLANIPFDVYGFTNDYYNTDLLRGRPNDSIFISDPKTEFILESPGFHLKHLIGSSLSSVAYRRSFNNLAILINEYVSNRYNSEGDTGGWQYDWTDSGFGLNGTPYIQTLLASREMIKKFRVNNKLDIVNVLYLTDGEGNTGLSLPQSAQNLSYDIYRKATFYYIDKKSQRKVRKEKYESEQSAITRLVKDVTGCKHLGFYLVSKREMKDQLASIDRNAEIGQNGYTSADVDKMRKSARENNFFAASSIGYDKYFYIGSSQNNITEDELTISQDMTKHKMARAFSKSLSSKKSNRILVSQFAEELASGL